MLGPALFLVAVLFLTVTVTIGGVGGFARATVHDAANAAIRTGFAHAVSDYQQYVAARIRASEGSNYYGDGQTWQNLSDVPSIAALVDPRTLSAPPARTERIGAYYVTETALNTTLAVPACSGGPPSPADDVAASAQCAPWVGESRMSAQILVTVYSGDPAQSGAVALAARAQTLALRLFADAPYVAVTGLKDGDARDPESDDPNAAEAHEGDASGTAAAGDTTIHVLYDCRNAGVPCPQNPNPPGDDPRNVPWRNGNIAPLH